MLTESTIREAVTEQVFHRGKLLEQTGGVRDFEMRNSMSEYGEPELFISATVRGSNLSSYQVEAFIDEEYDDFYDAYCECPAYAAYDGICKHCVALLLHYLKERDYQFTWDEFANTQDKPLPARKTDRGFEMLLRKYGQREALAYSDSFMQGKVRLEPTLHLIYGRAEVSLKIGTDKMYVVKDIAELIRHVRNVSTHSYGAKLTLTHHMDMFDDKSKMVMEFLLRHLEGVDELYGNAIRRVSLDTGALDEFLELTGYQGILVEFQKKDKEVMVLTDEPFRKRLRIIGAEDGIVLKLSREITLQTQNWSYIFLKDKIYRISRKHQQQADEFEGYMMRYVSDECFVAEEDIPLFVREMLPVLEKSYQIYREKIELEKYMPEEVRFLLYLDLPQKDLITCDLVAEYADERKYHVFEGISQKENRNIRREAEMAALVSGYCNAFDGEKHLQAAAGDDDCMYRLLTEGIEAFQKEADVFVSDRLKRIQMIQTPKVNVGVSLNGNLLELNLESEGMDLEQLAAILSKYDRKKKFYRLKSGEFISMEHENLATMAQIQKGLMLTEKQIADGNVSLPKFRALYLDAQFQENQAFPVEKSRDFKALIRNMKTVEDSDFEVPKALAKILREYQKKGYLWLETLYANGFGGILADDMGLGKTLQVITFLYSHYVEQKDVRENTLIVCPASLVYNWEYEFGKFAPEISVCTVAGTAARRQSLWKEHRQRTVFITSYDLLRRDIELCQEMEFAFQIIDEAQFIKNANTKAAHAVKQIISGFRIALTGTPVENRLSELWSIFDYLMPGYLYSYQRFREDLEQPIVQRHDKDCLSRLQKMIAPFILRRLKKDVLKDLPDKLEKKMFAKMEGGQKELYQAHVQRLQILLSKQTPEEFDKSKIQILAELTRLRQLCCDPALLYENYEAGSAKMEMCVELIRNAVEGDHKILLFSQFTSMLNRIAEKLKSENIAFYMLTGATQKQGRIRMVNAFNQDAVPVFLISLKAGGTGLNLTAADIVIHYDPWWNTAVQNQATDRAHRIGQKNTVMVYKLISKDTIEENIVKLQEQKQELAEQVLGGKDVQRSAFTREELLDLLKFQE